MSSLTKVKVLEVERLREGYTVMFRLAELIHLCYPVAQFEKPGRRMQVDAHEVEANEVLISLQLIQTHYIIL